jgi:hypothetical protein
LTDTSGDFDSLVDASFSKVAETPAVETPSAEPATGSTPEVKAAEPEAQQEQKESEPEGSTPEPTQTSPVVDDSAVLERFVAKQDEPYRNLIQKYRASGVSLEDAITQANSQASTAYWNETKAKAEAAKAQKEQPGSTPEPVQPTPTAVEIPAAPELQTIDDRIRAFTAEKTDVEQKHGLFSGQLQNIQQKIRQLTVASVNPNLDFEKKQAVEQELLGELAKEEQHIAFLNHLVDTHGRLEGQLGLLSLNRQVLATQLQDRAAREAAIRERQRSDEESVKAAEVARWSGIKQAWESSSEAVAKEGEAVDPDLFAEFKDDALTYVARQDPKTAAEVPALIREFKAKWDAKNDKVHRAKSKVYAAKKERDTSVNAPEGEKAVAPTTVKRGPFHEDEWDMAVNSRWKTA